MLTETQVLEVARRVLAEGRKFKRGWHDEGTPESGPTGGSTPTVAWGRAELYVSRNGSCYLVLNNRCRDGMPAHYTVFGSYLGSGHWGGSGDSFWVNAERQQIRNAVKG